MILFCRYGGESHTAVFSVASQLIQIFVILSVVLNIGINILLPQTEDHSKAQLINVIYTYSLILEGRGSLFALSLILMSFINMDLDVKKIYLLLSLSIIPLPLICRIVKYFRNNREFF